MDNFDGAVCTCSHRRGHTAKQEAFESPEPTRSNKDTIRSPLFRLFYEDALWVTFLDNR